jgi:hypothetical protein
VHQILHLLLHHKIFLKHSKCAFLASEVEYLGHIIGKAGVWEDPKKIEAMQDWNCPKTIKILHGFLGLTDYYRKFVRNYGKISSPLISLFKNNYFTLTLAPDQAFQDLKEAMCTTSVLALPVFKKPLSSNVMPREEELELSLWKRVDLWPLLENNYLNSIWANQSMKRKCWLFCMQWIRGTLVSWVNASKLTPIIKSSSIF